MRTASEWERPDASRPDKTMTLIVRAFFFDSFSSSLMPGWCEFHRKLAWNAECSLEIQKISVFIQRLVSTPVDFLLINCVTFDERIKIKRIRVTDSLYCSIQSALESALQVAEVFFCRSRISLENSPRWLIKAQLNTAPVPDNRHFSVEI